MASTRPMPAPSKHKNIHVRESSRLVLGQGDEPARVKKAIAQHRTVMKKHTDTWYGTADNKLRAITIAHKYPRGVGTVQFLDEGAPWPGGAWTGGAPRKPHKKLTIVRPASEAKQNAYINIMERKRTIKTRLLDKAARTHGLQLPNDVKREVMKRVVKNPPMRPVKKPRREQ